MAKSELDRLIDRYLHGQVTEKERIKLETWLEIMKTDKAMPRFLTIEEENELAGRLMNQVDNIDEIKTYKPVGAERSIFFNRSFRIAASIVLLAAVSFTVWRFTASSRSIDTIGLTDQVEKRILDDGSIVWLKGGSNLTYTEDTNAGTRNVSLTGEGLFEVAKDPSRPFLISGGGVTAKVLGTSFNIKTNADGVELKVLTGTVNLSSKVDQNGINVTRNEKIVYSNSGPNTKSVLPATEAEAIAASTEYNMKFADQKMSAVLDKIKNKFDVTINVANTQLNNCKVTADFTDQSLDKTFVMLSGLLDITYKITGTTVIVSGKGCH